MTDDPTNQRLTRVLIAAATPALRAGLRALLTNERIWIVGETSSLVQLAALPVSDVIVIADETLLATLPPRGSEDQPGLLLLSDNEHALDLLSSATGWGLLPRDVSPEELQAATLAVGQHFTVLAPALANRLLTRRPSSETLAEEPIEPLTSREREVLEQMSQGLSNKAIAQRLQISEHTVKFHISAILAKLGANSRTDAVSRAARQGLITL